MTNKVKKLESTIHTSSTNKLSIVSSRTVIGKDWLVPTLYPYSNGSMTKIGIAGFFDGIVIGVDDLVEIAGYDFGDLVQTMVVEDIAALWW